LNGKRRHALTVWLGSEKKNTGKRVRKGDGMEVWGRRSAFDFVLIRCAAAPLRHQFRCGRFLIDAVVRALAF